MTVSRWCAAPRPEIWEDMDGAPFKVDQHARCRFERWSGHDEYDYASADEKESWDCSCDCHKANYDGR